MQLTKSGSIAAALAGATCALLGHSPAVQAQDALKDWKFDTAILLYSEVDRVSLAEGVINASKTFNDDSVFNAKIALDGLTGASANGAVSQPNAQTFSGPSGNGSYNTPANTVPLDETFKDTRVQVSGSYLQPFGDSWRATVGGNVSSEYDYLSIGANGLIEKDLYQRNTTISTGLSLQFDTIKPVGGVPTPLASMSASANSYDDDDYTTLVSNQGVYEDDEHDDDDGGHGEASTDNKTTVDFILGVTQIVNRRMLMQVNLSLSQVSGYMTDPYKVLSVVNTQGLTQDVVYEGRPDSRTKQSIYWQTKYALDNGVADVSYRYATDDWNLTSHTIDSRLRMNFGESSYLQPHVRYYQQSAAEFYRPFLLESEVLPAYASADYRVGEMTAFTLGLKYGQKLENDKEWAVRVEYYQQNPKNAGYDEPGLLKEQELYPSIKAMMVQFNYHF